MEALRRGFPDEDLSGAFVEHLLVGAKLLMKSFGKVGALGQVVADAVVLTFTGGALPRTVRVAEEDLQSEVGGQGDVFGHFLSLVVDEGFPQGGWDRLQLARNVCAHGRSVPLWEVAQKSVAGGGLNQHSDGGAVAHPHNQVAVVVAGDQPRFHFGRPLIVQHYVLQFALSGAHSAAAGFSPTVATAQAGHQLLRITRPHQRLQFDSLRQGQMLVSHRLALGTRGVAPALLQAASGSLYSGLGFI